MKKKILAALLASAMLVSVAGCNQEGNTPANTDGGNNTNAPANNPDGSAWDPATGGTGAALSDSEGKVFNIWCWNEEYKGFFEKYYKVPEGITVKWTVNTNEGGVYQQKLDEALLKQDSVAADEKIDMFLAEADYINKYVDSPYTKDVSEIGWSTLPTQYDYTVKAATSADGKLKGVSFQCCPAGVIYRRSIAKDVIGSDDPADVQAALSDWTKFDDVAKQAKEKGYYMTPSFVSTYRTYSNNTTGAWMDANNNITIDAQIDAYLEQAKTYVEKGYTQPYGIWSDETNNQMFKDSKTMCFFGPAWYYNFSMTNAQDPEKGCSGDWGLCEGPAAYFWGGTWLLASSSTDNPEMLRDVFGAFTANAEIIDNLISKEMQFSNNTTENEKFATDPKFANAFLGGQNDVALYVELAKNIKWEPSYKTIYDQYFNEKFPDNMLPYMKGDKTKEECLKDFGAAMVDAAPEVVSPF